MSVFGKFREILYIKDSPHRLAKSFALGVLIAISPFLGLHTLMGIAACFLFRVNKFVLFVGVYVTNPWTIIPIYTFSTWVGALLVGADLTGLHVDWRDMSLMTLVRDIKPIILPFFVGSTVVSIVAAPPAYFMLKKAIVRAQASRPAHRETPSVVGGDDKEEKN